SAFCGTGRGDPIFATAIRLARRWPRRTSNPESPTRALYARRLINLRTPAVFTHRSARKSSGLKRRTASGPVYHFVRHVYAIELVRRSSLFPTFSRHQARRTVPFAPISVRCSTRQIGRAHV